MIMEWLKKLNLIHDLVENYYKYIPLPSVTYGHTGVHNMSFKKKKKQHEVLPVLRHHSGSAKCQKTLEVQN